MSVPLQLYIIGGFVILVPILALIFLRKSHKYRISSVISGIGSYFLVTNVLMGVIGMLLSSVGLNSAFWGDHIVISESVNVIMNVVLQNVTLYLVMKYVLKGNIRIYDAFAIGVSYWLSSAFMLSTSAVSYARVSSMASEGRLSEMVTETLSLEALQGYATELQEKGISSFYIQVIGIFVLAVVAACLCVFLFHAIKRKNIKFLWMAIGGHAVVLTAINFSIAFSGNTLYLVANAVALAIAIFVLMKYWNWYKGQQAELLRRKQEYKQRLKAAGGNVISVKPTAEIEEE